MKNKYPVFETYDFSDCREITGDELYLINGGERVENSNEAVANAQVGDTVERDDGTVVTITQGDIDWAKEHTSAGGNDPSQTTPAASEPAPESQPSTPTNSSSTTGSTSQANTTNSSSSPTQSSTISKSSNLTDRGYPSSTEGYSKTDTSSNVSKVNKNNSANNPSSSTSKGYFDSHDPTRYITDLDNKEALQQAAELLTDPNLGIRVTAYGSKSAITKDFKNYAEINDYLNDNHSLISEEINVKSFLKTIEKNPDNYSIEAYQRKALIPYKGKIYKTLTHSLYVITDRTTGEKSTLSFNGAGPIGFISQGAWALNTSTDIKSWNSYVEGKNIYDMSLYRGCDGIDVQKTAANIIASINSNTSYMAIDHKWDWFNWENCNTALYNTIEGKERLWSMSPQ